jgi:hypothetical protein
LAIDEAQPSVGPGLFAGRPQSAEADRLGEDGHMRGKLVLMFG